MRREKLQRHGAFEPQILGFVHNAHAALAELLKNLIVRYCLADHLKSYSERIPSMERHHGANLPRKHVFKVKRMVARVNESISSCFLCEATGTPRASRAGWWQVLRSVSPETRSSSSSPENAVRFGADRRRDGFSYMKSQHVSPRTLYRASRVPSYSRRVPLRRLPNLPIERQDPRSSTFA